MFKWQTLGLACLIVLLTGCDSAPAQRTTAHTAVQPVKLHTVGSLATQRYRQFPAVIEAAQVAQLAFRVGGEISAFPIKPGTAVEQGELIAKLDPTDYQLVLDQAQARYELAQAQFERTESLVEQGVISQQQFDETKANLDVARANLETAKANLRYTELRAPFAGTVAHKFVEAFETVQPQRPIATLQMDDAIDISIRVPEQLFARVQRQLDYQPEVIFASAPEQSFRAKLKEWDTTADPATNTYKVVFTMPTPKQFNVLPGMSATVRVDTLAVSTGPAAGVLIPTAAVFSETTTAVTDAHRVWVFTPEPNGTGSQSTGSRGTVNQGTVSQREITVGRVTDSSIEITSGLANGEQIVVAGVHSLHDGQTVRPWTKERGL
ncbi:Toluene efflux pump periplasmic linker protein TtgD [Pseudidiomarina piscicola]|uniref:Toluene efflux pump periplasmic linker protein TtgD n=1 Tax=Pseudidiomarina piscicola TaxID=2614830 RepID=A0A6S6WMJ5_9GAMM|nr:efflux RND transporter periplasmic adaptor subunit [Pseudidiomarina piscicola]CAB0151022.1 Toluene efflux pump periplasmic linker protein TtgD [Pseudidiomarina piscicola]VZT40533.1 Toluene efflux pump periplasmic linker protein TtgD [Pseudomonas aeruginosa]